MPTRRAPRGYVPSLPPGCSLREYCDEDAESLVDVLRAAFGSWPRRETGVPAIDHLRWKLSSHSSARHLVVEQDERIIAFAGMWVSRLRIDGRSALCRYSVDRAVVPEMQGLRVMTAIDARTPREWLGPFDVVIGTSNNWQSVNFVPGSRHPRVVNVVARETDRGPDMGEDVSWMTRAVDAFDERVDVLWDAASAVFRQGTERNMDWLNYRFTDPRAGTYKIRIAETDGELLGYVIFSAHQEDGQIVDTLVRPGRDDVLSQLLHHAFEELRTAGCLRVECWRDLHHPYGGVLDKLGFRPRRNLRITFHSQAKEDELAFIDDPRAPIHIMAGDTDLV